jgi:hypothetical protein
MMAHMNDFSTQIYNIRKAMSRGRQRFDEISRFRSSGLLLILALLAAMGCTSDMTSNLKDPKKYCQVHGDSLIEGVLRAGFVVGNSSDSAFVRAGRRLFPNTRNMIFLHGGDKGTVYLHCPSCDSAWKAYRPE